jgi:protocatechuate 3,4-dioxygenase beta subunit
MTSTLRLCAVSIVCAILLSPAVAVAQPPQSIQINPDGAPMQFLAPGRQAKTGTGRLRGRVVAGDTGTIIRRAQVRISSPDIGTKTAFTDAQGRYEFKDLPAGRFNVSVSKSGFVTMQYGQSRPFEPGRPIELADAQAMEKADVALPRGSAVQGHVVDEFGEAVADASVSAMRMQYSQGKRRLTPTGRASTTNDQGYFRIFGLPPGEYYLSATVRTLDTMVFDMLGASAGGPTGSNSNSGYAASYYPGTASPAEAQRLSLAVGQELSNIDIQLQPVKLARISGVASGSDGKPMSGALVMLMPTMKDALQFMPGGTSRTDKDGNFTVSGVAPGDYSLQIQAMAALMNAATQAMTLMGGDAPAASAPATPPAEREFATAAVSVTGEDITGLVVTASRGAHATGRVVFEDAAPPDTVTALRLIAAPTDADTMPAAASVFGMSSVKETGAFEIDGLVGGRTFRIINMPKGWHFKQLTREGADITDKGYDFKPGEDVSGFELVLTTKTQTITGTVSGAQGESVKDYTVVAFPEDQQKWTTGVERWIGTARPDQQGQFKITDLPAGAYLAIAVDYVPQGEWQDPAWLDRAVKSATKFTLDEGATKTLDLKVVGGGL